MAHCKDLRRDYVSTQDSIMAGPTGYAKLTPDEFLRQAHAFHQAGFQLHIHTDGDEATELAIETFSRLLAEDPRPDHRHVLQHCQLADEDQFRRMKDLGLCVNIFANRVKNSAGDIHYAVTVRPERAERMNATGTAHRTGIPYSIHSGSRSRRSRHYSLLGLQ